MAEFARHKLLAIAHLMEESPMIAEKSPPKFTVGQKVKLVRALHEDYGPEVGFIGTVTEVDDIIVCGVRVQVNYDVSGHYVHEEELEAVDG